VREAHLHSLVGLPPSQLWEALDHLEQTAVVYVRHTGAGAVHGTRMVRILLAGRLLLSPGTLAPCIGPVRRPRRLRRSPCTAGRFRPAVCCDARAPAPRLRPPSGRLPARSTRPARCSPAGGTGKLRPQARPPPRDCVWARGTLHPQVHCRLPRVRRAGRCARQHENERQRVHRSRCESVRGP
jgi:hypothetical protein